MWFANIGCRSGDGYINSVDDIPDSPDFSWLPTARDCSDPFVFSEFHHDKLALELYKQTLIELRPIKPKHPGLYSPPHDFTNPAKSALLYCIVRADFAERNNLDTPWISIHGIYKQGHWPLGFIGNHKNILIL